MTIAPRFLEGAAFGVLNDILAGFRVNEGYAVPNKYEVMIHPPQLQSSNSASENLKYTICQNYYQKKYSINMNLLI